MRADLGFTRDELEWRSKHGVSATERRMLNRQARRLLAKAFGAVPAGPHGFDVSSYQPAAPNFRAGGRSFAIFKATEGTSYFDRNFTRNRAAAHAQGCTAIGLYHFARPGSSSADAQWAWMSSHVGPPQPGEFIVLDFEVSPWNQAWIVRFIRLAQAAGWNVAFYSYAGMLAANPTDQLAQATPYLWIAAYSSNPPGSDRWAHWTLWQHTDGAGASADGPWDCSVGEPTLLAQLARSSAPPAPVPPAPPKPPFVSEEESMLTDVTAQSRRVDEAEKPVPWTSEKDGKKHPYVYDIDCNEDGHRLGTVVIVSWFWVRAANADQINLGPLKGRARVSIWSQAKGRWLDGEVDPNGFVTAEDRGWPVPSAGIHSIVSIDDIPLKVIVERNVIPV